MDGIDIRVIFIATYVVQINEEKSFEYIFFINSIGAGTHHVDLSGEPYYMELMQLKYNDLAHEKGVYIVSACGFDSIPADIGVKFFEDKFDGEVHSIETYLKSWATEKTEGAAYAPIQ